MIGCCASCGRKLELTAHHLIPKEMHNKKWCRKMHTIEEMHNTVMVCHDCHSAFHKFISNKDLAKWFYTLESLLEHPRVYKFVKWVSKNENRKFKH